MNAIWGLWLMFIYLYIWLSDTSGPLFRHPGQIDVLHKGKMN